MLLTTNIYSTDIDAYGHFPNFAVCTSLPWCPRITAHIELSGPSSSNDTGSQILRYTQTKFNQASWNHVICTASYSPVSYGPGTNVALIQETLALNV